MGKQQGQVLPEEEGKVLKKDGPWFGPRKITGIENNRESQGKSGDKGRKD